MDTTGLTARADRESAVYRENETVRFRVTGPWRGAVYQLNNGREESAPRPLTAPEVATSLDRPGFLRLKLISGGDTAYAGAAVAPEKIRPGTTMPEDFAAFWQKELDALRRNELAVSKFAAIPKEHLPAGLVGYDVAVRRGDVTATGYLVRPETAAPGTLPATLNFNGASKVSAELPAAVAMARNTGAISFNLNFHGLENFNLRPERELAREAAIKPLVADYQFNCAADPRRYAMRKIFLRVVLAADFVRALPEFDGRRLAAAGGSLGGAQALVCAALVPEVKWCVSNATAMCDHFGRRAGHLPGWPGLLDRVPEADRSAAYFDMANFAALVRCPTRMAVGFIDTTCPPAATYAAYNRLGTADREMRHTVTGGHGGVQDPRDVNVFDQHMADLRAALDALRE